MAASAITFFGIDGTAPTTPPTTTAPPTTTPPPTTTAPPTTPPGGGACTASYRQTGSWPGGFQGEVTVRAGTSPVTGWTVGMGVASGVTVSQLWNGTLSGSGSSYTVRNASWNGSIGANGSTVFGFLASGAAAAPTLTCTSP